MINDIAADVVNYFASSYEIHTNPEYPDAPADNPIYFSDLLASSFNAYLAVLLQTAFAEALVSFFAPFKYSNPQQ